MKTLLVLALAAGLWAGAVEAQDRRGWANLTVGQWRKYPPDYQGGVIMGAMNMVAALGATCRTPISAGMVVATIRATGDAAPVDDDLISSAVWEVMAAVYDCHLRGTKNSIQPPSAHTQ